MADLDKLMAAVLVRLELASHTAAQTLDSAKVSHGKPGGNEPPRVSAPHLHYERRWNNCRDVERRKALIVEALNELRSIRYSRKPTVDRETREGKLIIGRDPRPANTVAYVYGFSVRHVHRLRAYAREVDSRSVRRGATLTSASFGALRAGSGR